VDQNAVGKELVVPLDREVVSIHARSRPDARYRDWNYVHIGTGQPDRIARPDLNGRNPLSRVKSEPCDRDRHRMGCWALRGEGCFYSGKTMRHRIPRATLSMTDEDIVRRFAAIVGCGSVVERVGQVPGNKTQWRWRTRSTPEARRVADLLLPYLGIRRSEAAHGVIGQAAIIPLANRDKDACPAGHPYGPESAYTASGWRRCRICINERKREQWRAEHGCIVRTHCVRCGVLIARPTARRIYCSDQCNYAAFRTPATGSSRRGGPG